MSELQGGQRQDFQIIVRKVVAALRQISSLHKSFFCRFGGKIVLEGYMYRDQNYLRYRDITIEERFCDLHSENFYCQNTYMRKYIGLQDLKKK